MERSGDGSQLQKRILIRKADVPAYLQNSEFYRSLQDDEEDDSILVPCDCMKMDDTVKSNDDLRSLLLTLRFWITGCISDSILTYAMSRPYATYGKILSEFCQDFFGLSVIEYLTDSSTPMLTAIEWGIIDFVKYFNRQGHPWLERSCESIVQVRNPNIELLKYAIETGCPIPKYAMSVAAIEGNLQCLKILRGNGASWNSGTTTAAVLGNDNIECLQYLHENGCPWLCELEEPDEDTSSDGESDDGYQREYSNESEWCNHYQNNICTLAAGNASLKCLKYAHSQGVPLQPRLMELAAAHSDGFECVKYGHQHGLPLTQCLYWHASEHDNLALMQYLNDNGFLCDRKVCERTARSCSLPTLLSLLQNGCPPSNNIWTRTGNAFDKVLECFLARGWSWSATPEVTVYATRSNNLEGLKRLLENGCPWHPDSTICAIRTFYIKLLTFVHENGCPWHPGTCLQAAYHGSLECLQYAHTHGAILPTDLCSVFWLDLPGPLNRMTLDCFIYAHQHGMCALSSNYTCNAAGNGQLELLKYLHEQGCPWHEDAAELATFYDHADCLEYVLSHGCPYTDAVYNAAKTRNLVECIAVIENYLSASGRSSADNP